MLDKSNDTQHPQARIEATPQTEVLVPRWAARLREPFDDRIHG